MSHGIEKEKLYKLTEIAYRVIKYEDLPRPYEIKFRNPVSGVRKRAGVCQKIGHTNCSYSIIVTTILAKFFPDPNGKFLCKKTGKKLRKAAIGTERSLDEVKETLAHEIAHLKFWNHTPEHKKYTEHILGEINKWWY